MPVGLCRVTRDGTFLHANLAFLRIMGYPSLAALQKIDARALYVNPGRHVLVTLVLEVAVAAAVVALVSGRRRRL